MTSCNYGRGVRKWPNFIEGVGHTITFFAIFRPFFHLHNTCMPWPWGNNRANPLPYHPLNGVT